MAGILCVYAHPDDESFGPAGTLALYGRAGVPGYLLCFTKGQYGERPPDVATPEALGRLREEETLRAAAIIGLKRAEVLDYVDGRLAQASFHELVEQVRRRLDELRPDVVITFGARGISGHGDHIVAGRATEVAARAFEEAHGPRLRLYYDAVTGPIAEMFKLSGPEASPTHTVDIAEVAQVKIAALECHASQGDARGYLEHLRREPPSFESFHRAWPAALAPGSDLFD